MPTHSSAPTGAERRPVSRIRRSLLALATTSVLSLGFGPCDGAVFHSELERTLDRLGLLDRLQLVLARDSLSERGVQILDSGDVSAVEGLALSDCPGSAIDMEAPLVPLDPIVETSVVTIGADRNLRVDGEPFFPIGMWNMLPDYFAEAAEVGFNIAGPHRGCCGDDGDLPRHIDYIQSAAQVGLRSIVVPLSDFYGDDLEEQRSWIEQRAALPGLLAWYSWDEPILNNFDPNVIRDQHVFLKSVDPDHPDIIVEPPVQGNYYTFRNDTDIQITDPYPYGISFVSNSLVTYGVDRLFSEALPGQPGWAGIQAHDQLVWLCQLPGWDVFLGCANGYTPTAGPSGPVMRNMTFQALSAGASAILYYAWAPGQWQMADWPEHYAELKEIVADISRLQPALLATDVTDSFVALEPEALLGREVPYRALHMSDADATVLLVTNASEQPKTIDLDLSARMDSDGVLCIGDLKQDPMHVPFRGGQIRLTLGPLEDMILQAAQPTGS